MTKQESYTITKKIAKHGKQNIIVIPKVLHDQIRPSMLVKITMDILDEGDK